MRLVESRTAVNWVQAVKVLQERLDATLDQKLHPARRLEFASSGKGAWGRAGKY